MLSAAALLIPILQLSTGQFVQAPTDLQTKTGYAGIEIRFKEVPTGICELDPNVKSYSGYADVAPDEHLFWWFFEARNVEPTEAPLTVWINGGPGSTSMLGLWQELGPCGVDYVGNVYSNPYSWSNVSNFLFVDQPATVGFSYTIPVPAFSDTSGTTGGEIVALQNETCPDYAEQFDSCGTWSINNETLTANTTANTAPNMWKLLQGFMGAFPQYSRNAFHFTTESYGGHYGPVMNEYFETQNAALPEGAHPISLQSVSIGNGWYSPLIQYQAYYNYTVSPGNPYDFRPFNASTEARMYNALYAPGNCVDKLQACYALGTNEVCSSADEFCADFVESLLDNAVNRDEYDVRELMPDPFPYGFFEDYLNTADVQKAIGAYTNFSEASNTVYDAFSNTGDDAREAMTIEDVRKLLDQGIYVNFYHGDADYNCNYLGGQVIADMVAAPGYDKAGYVDVQTSDGVVHGQVRQSGNFSFMRVYLSGHEVPFYQPLASLEMFERVIAGKDIATGKVDVAAMEGYMTMGPSVSGFREGNETVQSMVLNENATYNYETGAPNPLPPMEKRDLSDAAFRKERPHRPAGRRGARRGKNRR